MVRNRVSKGLVSLLGFVILVAMCVAHPLLAAGQGPQQATQTGPLRLEDGTPIKLRLTHNLSSATAQTNDRVDFDVLEEVKVGDLVVIPKGSIGWGTVTEAQAKRRMGRGGKLDVNIDSVRLANGDKAALRGVKDVKGGGHGGAMTGGIVATSLVMWPAAPLFLLMHGKDVTMPQGTELTVYINGDCPIDPAKFGGATPTVTAAPSPHPVAPSPTGGGPTIVLIDPSVTDSGETVNVTTSTLTIRGVVTDPSGIPAVTINDNPTGLHPKGPQAAAFMSDPIKLHAGENVFEIVATDAAHVQARMTFVARYTPSVVVPVQTVPQSNGKGLAKAEIFSLLQGGVSSARVTEIVGQRGISFVPTSDDIKDIRAAGGGDDLANGLSKAKLRR
jgi:hypothetical protein